MCQRGAFTTVREEFHHLVGHQAEITQGLPQSIMHFRGHPAAFFQCGHAFSLRKQAGIFHCNGGNVRQLGKHAGRLDSKTILFGTPHTQCPNNAVTYTQRRCQVAGAIFFR